MLTTKDPHEFVSFRPDVSLIALDDAVPFSFGCATKGIH
jgi:hypothetical protein